MVSNFAGFQFDLMACDLGSLTRRGYMEESDKRGVGGEGHLGLID